MISQGADAVRRHGRERRQPLRQQRRSRCTSSRPAPARSPTTPAASSPRSNLTMSGDVDLGRRLGHQLCAAARRRATTAASRKLARPDQGDGRILDRSLGRAGQRRAGRRAHRQLLRRHHGPQLHARPDACTTTTLQPRDDDRRERRRRALDAVGGRGAAGDAAARGRDLRPGQRPPHLRERRVHRRRRPGRRRPRSPTGTTPSRSCSATRSANDRQWQGVVRMVAIHNRALTQAQIQQNFEAGVGERSTCCSASRTWSNVPQSYVMFEVQPVRQLLLPVQQADLHQPRPAARTRTSIPHQGPAHRRQRRRGEGGPGLSRRSTARSRLAATSRRRASASSDIGTVVALEKGPSRGRVLPDLRAARHAHHAFVEPAPTPLPPPPDDVPRPSDIGLRDVRGDQSRRCRT